MNTIRIRCHLTRYIYLLLLVLATSVSCSEQPPSDPIAAGTLCLPETRGCFSELEITRPSVGRNAMDIALVNHGDSTTAEIIVSPLVNTTTTAEDTTLNSDTPQADTSSLPITISYPLAHGEAITEQIDSYHLGTSPQIAVALSCPDPSCHVSMDFIFIAESLQCVDDSECGRYSRCNIDSARCVECLSSSDCLSSQSCEIETGRCTPPVSQGCSSNTTSPANIFLPGLAILGLIIIRQKRHSLRSMKRLCTHFLFVMVVAFVYTPPSLASGPSTSMTVGLGPRLLIGNVGAHANSGYGLVIGQHIRSEYVGISTQIYRSFFSTNQPAPPVNQDMQMQGIAIGPRYYLHLAPVALIAALDYHRLGLSSNSLIRYTGPALSYNSFSASLGTEYHRNNISFRVDLAYQAVIDFPGDIISLNIHIGLFSF